MWLQHRFILYDSVLCLMRSSMCFLLLSSGCSSYFSWGTTGTTLGVLARVAPEGTACEALGKLALSKW